MKKTLITLIAVAMVFSLLLLGDTYAQGLTAKGLKVGLNIANFGGSDAENNSSVMGFTVGGFVVWSLSDNLGIRPEILYSKKGSELEVDDETSLFPFKAAFNLSYLEIPILFQYTIPTKGSFKPNIFIGPSLNIVLDSKIDLDVLGIGVEMDYDDIKTTDFGLVFGVGAVWNDKFTIDARYSLGLTSIDDTAKDEEEALIESPPYDWKNNVISVMVGYSF